MCRTNRRQIVKWQFKPNHSNSCINVNRLNGLTKNQSSQVDYKNKTQICCFKRNNLNVRMERKIG